jgi:tetratricopeptide (TPR) repeat protein
VNRQSHNIDPDLEQRVRSFLSDLLMDVPILRKQGSPEQYLGALQRAIFFHPVFPNWPGPMDEWLAESERLSREMNRADTLATTLVRRAVVRMRHLEYEEALAELNQLETAVPALPLIHTLWRDVTRARVLTRMQQFDEARPILDGVTASKDHWFAALPVVARGELHLEANEIDAADGALLEAWEALPFELVEERIQVQHLLAFVRIVRADVRAALQHLDIARRMLRGASAWIEVAQMNMSVGSLLVSAGDQYAAQRLFEEGLELLSQHPQPQLETLLHMALARSQSAQGHTEAALQATVQAAQLHAKAGNLVGFVSMIVLMANLLIDAQRYQQAYSILVTGVGIARHRKWPVVESVLRTHINRLREDTMGTTRFDSMVQKMIDQL